MRSTRAGRLSGAVAIAFAIVTAGPLAPGAEAVAPGCDAAHPTFIGGPIHGYPDDRALNALIGVDQVNSAGTKVDPNGVPCGQPGSSCCGGYSWCDSVNPTLPPSGSTDPTLDRSWGRCVSSATVQAFLEIYPKNPSGTTDKSRYGAAAHYYQPITVGGNNNAIDLRLPLTYEAGGGNTGYVNGYLTFGGHAIPTQYITRVRAFTTGRGPECGVEGFSAAADQLAPSGSLDATYYRVAYLAGGRCGAASQRYSLYIDCTTFCGAGTRTQQRAIDIRQGAGIRVDIASW